MANDNETVEQVALSDLPLAEQLRIIRGNYCAGSGEFDALDEAADVVECNQREKKYEYSEKYSDGEISPFHDEERIDFKYTLEGSVVVRREVGEWEEVRNDRED